MCLLHFCRRTLVKKGCFLFHFESSFRSWDNQIQIFKCHDVVKCLSIKHETHFTESTQSGDQMRLVYVLLKKNFIKIFYEKCDLETSSRPYLIFKESSVKRNLRTSLSTDKNWHWKSEHHLKLVIFSTAVYLSAMEKYHVLAHNVINVSF